MSQPLTDGQFSWVPVAELEAIRWEEQRDGQEFGYIVEVDFDYPAELHVLDNDLPCAPERVYVQNEWFSEKQVFLRAQYNLPRTDFNAKLIPNLMNKKKYVVDFRLLKFYIQHGLILHQDPPRYQVPAARLDGTLHRSLQVDARASQNTVREGCLQADE